MVEAQRPKRPGEEKRTSARCSDLCGGQIREELDVAGLVGAKGDVQPDERNGRVQTLNLVAELFGVKQVAELVDVQMVGVDAREEWRDGGWLSIDVDAVVCEADGRLVVHKDINALDAGGDGPWHVRGGG